MIDLGEAASSRVQPSVTENPIGTGFWVSSPDAGPIEADDLARRMMPEDPIFTRLLIGGPGQPMPTLAQLVGVIRSMDAEARDSLMVTVYGAEPTRDHPVAQQLADALNFPIRARHGLLLPGPEQGQVHTTALDPAGRPSWRPFAQVSIYQPGLTGATVQRWNDPAPGLTALAAGSYRLTARWTLDVVPAGLVVRPAGVVLDPALRRAPTDPERVDLVIDGQNGETLPDDMLTALGRLADALPTVARRRLQVLLTPGIKPSCALALRYAVPAPQFPWSASEVVDLAVSPSLSDAGRQDEPEPEPEPAMSPTPPATTLVISSQGRMLLV